MRFKKDIPENYGISSKAILDFIEVTEQDEEINLKTFMLLHDNNILAQFSKRPYKLEDQQLLFSMTKSFASLGVGIAADKGYLNIEDKVISYFPDKLPEEISDNLSKIKVKHLLTMTSGIHDNTYEMLYSQKDWVKAFLAQNFPHEPGTYYRYSTHGSHMLSALVEKATGQSLLEFLNDHLFKPLDIPKPQWETCPSGMTAGGMGLSLAPESMAKIGVMLLNKGIYQGKRILSQSYINEATSPHVFKHTERDKENRIYSGLHYGYQIHIGQDNYFRLDGAFGQICLVVPEKNIIVVATSKGTKTEKLLKYIYKHLLDSDYIEENLHRNYYNELKNKLNSLEYTAPSFRDIPVGIQQLNNCAYIIDDNPNGIKKVMFNQNGQELIMSTINSDNLEYKVKFDFSEPVHHKGMFIKDIQSHNQKYISYAKWLSNSELELHVIYVETPYVVKYRFSFIESGIKMEFFINVSFTLKDFTAVGRLDL
ncbi:serine hydrolase domain-containing protein [Oceanirhabdus seepicola]|uniref:Serine hydrolase n=1 Tax=Oceanirhabdus seepicola TaxID=2828781 RepID=A0A9J6NXE0_9CLOT|nr:serine hydrolase [Oceanirhabdus seepicola]MCM1989122.1 serine hydrolase [Oceanirhabdus seepicola]